MNEKLRHYLDTAFAPYSDRARIDELNELKEEILHNLQDRYDDLKAEGKSDEEAYQETIESLGNIDELIGEEIKPGVKPRQLNNFLFRKMHYVDFGSMRMQDSRFRYSSLRGANFTDADLSGSIFIGCNLRDARFDGAKLNNVKFNATSLNGASFKGASLDNTLFDKISLNSANFSGMSLKGVRFKAASLKNVTFEDAVLNDVVFEFTTALKNANFRGATMDQLTYGMLVGKDVNLSGVVVVD